MSQFEIIIPKMGESVVEATISKWLKKIGETIKEDDVIAEIATDKVDSEITSPVNGILKELKYQEGDVAAVGAIIAVVETDIEISDTKNEKTETKTIKEIINISEPLVAKNLDNDTQKQFVSNKHYSPLVRTIAKEEGLSLQELDSIIGSGQDNRVTKQDLLNYIANKTTIKTTPKLGIKIESPQIQISGEDNIIEMDRMRKLIADHMLNSVQTSPHVTSFIEVKMGKVVKWRENMKKQFEQKYGEKLTYTHIIVEAITQALLEFPNVNASVDGYKIIQRKQINIGIATALPSGNLIVPVVKNAAQKNLLGIVTEVNKLANAARTNTLSPDDIVGGTFTFTNLGSFASLTGTPIINQPQVAILAAGVIHKKPIVIETLYGDTIGIEPVMILSLSYDHRIVDGAMGGLFIKRIADFIEKFDINRTI